MSKKKPVSIGSLLTSGSGTGKSPTEPWKDQVGWPPDTVPIGCQEVQKPMVADNWNKVSNNMQRCELCMHYAGMRCRRHAPKGQEGWPAVFPTDYCGDHKMSKQTMAKRA